MSYFTLANISIKSKRVDDRDIYKDFGVAS